MAVGGQDRPPEKARRGLTEGVGVKGGGGDEATAHNSPPHRNARGGHGARKKGKAPANGRLGPSAPMDGLKYGVDLGKKGRKPGEKKKWTGNI